MGTGAWIDRYSWRIAFIFGTGYVFILFFLALLFFVPDLTGPLASLKAPPFYGPIPSGVLWFGALGGVLISFVGIHEHRYDWDPKFLSWHIARPIVGASVAVVAVLIVMSGILAVGSSPSPDSAGAAGNVFYFLVAFLVGYRERHFRELIKRLGDAVFTSKDETAGPTISGLSPAMGPTGGGTPVTITGADFANVSAVRFGDIPVKFKVVSSQQIDVPASPQVAQAGAVPVTVITEAGTAGGQVFTYV